VEGVAVSCGAGAGQYDQRITIQDRVPGTDELGQVNGAWVAIAPEMWASAMPMTGRERFASGQMQVHAPVTFRIPYRTDITIKASMRVLWRGEPYEITAPPIDVKGARTQLEILCVGGLRDGRDDV